MPTRYISTAEARVFNPSLTAESDAYVESLINQAEAMIDSYLGGYDFSTGTITAERHDFIGAWPYYFKYPPTGITAIWATVISPTEGTDYVKKDRRILFADSTLLDGKENTTFNFITFTYTKSSTIPQNVKTACLILMNEVYTNKGSNAIAEYEQGDFRIKYRDWGFGGNTDNLYEIKKLLAPYRNVNVVS